MGATAILQVLSAGAGRGLVTTAGATFERDASCSLHAVFAAAGPLGDRLADGAPCDVFISTEAQVDQWTARGSLRAGTSASLGTVQAAVAARAGRSVPDIATPAAFAAALEWASTIYLPDIAVSTAGRHIVAVLERLGLADKLASRMRTFASGDAAMRALAEDPDPDALGCTQATEITHVPGLTCVGPLPPGYALATVYTAAVGAGAEAPDLAGQFVAYLASPATSELRQRNGFEP